MNEIPDPVREAARERPDAPALITPDETVSYADLDRRVAAAVVGLRAHGLTRGDRLAIYLPTSVEYLVLLLAAFRMGVVACPLSTRLPAAAAPGLLDRIACRTLVAEPGASWDELRVIPPPLPGKATGSGGVEGSVWRLDAPATIFFTSGSTGTPKAALHTLGNHVFSAQGAGSFFDLRAGDRWMLNLPLFHVGGLGVLFRCVLSGAAIVLPSPGAPVEAVVAEHGVTHASMVATQLLRVLRGPDAEALRRLKVLLLGGSAIPPGLLDEAHARGLPVHTSYGMTEMASTVTATPPRASRALLGTSGFVLPHRELKFGTDGEILVRGATLFAGYVEDDTVGGVTDTEGWFPTGDLGTWEEFEGMQMLRVVGRKDNLFISGGENVQPEEIEAALGRLPGVRQAVVVPVADAEFGQRPVAFVEAERWTPEAWRDALAEAMARFKVPSTFYPLPDEANEEMKVGRAWLREQAVRPP